MLLIPLFHSEISLSADLEKLVNSARLCTMIFSTGEAIPYQHYGMLLVMHFIPYKLINSFLPCIMYTSICFKILSLQNI